MPLPSIFSSQRIDSDYPKLTVFVFMLLQLLFAGYALRSNVPYNFEIVFAPLLLVFGYLFFKEKHRLQNRPLQIWVGLVLAYSTVVLLTSAYHAPLGEEGWSLILITALMSGFLLLLVVLYLLKPSIDFFWSFFIGASIVMLIWFGMELSHWGWEGISQGRRMGGVYGHPIKFGIYANGLFIIMLGGLIWAYRKGHLVFSLWVFLIVTNLMAVIFSQTRTAWIGWPEALIGWGLFYLALLVRSNQSVMTKSLLVSFPLLAVVVLLSMDSVYKVFEKRVDLAVSDTERYLSGQSPFSSLGLRYVMYETGYELIKEKPFTGHGADAFSENLKVTSSRILKEKFHRKHPGLTFTQIHNQFLMSWVNYGVLAVIGLLSMFGFLFWHFVKGVHSAALENKPIWIAGLVFSVASFLSFMPESPLQYSTYSSHFLLIISLLLVFSFLDQDRNKSRKS